MTYKEKYESTKSWRKKIFVMGLYYRVQFARSLPSTISAVAQYFNVSTGLVSENLLLADPENYKAIRRCKSRKAALILIKGK